MVGKVDTTRIKFNQASIIAFVLLAYALDVPWLVLFVGLVLGVGTAWPKGALFQQVYGQVLKPLGLLKPHTIEDDPTPHRFAQGLGAAVLGLSSLALLVLHAPGLGWLLAGLVTMLAAINLFLDFCAGCFMYYQLTRLGLVQRSQTR